MNPSDRDHLLRDILADEKVEQLRQTSLDRGLATLRARRRRRRLFPAVASSLAAVALFAILTSAPREREAPVAGVASPALSTTPSSLKIIDDRELLALFPDRSVALIGEPGNQKLFFLDTGSSRAARAQSP